MAAIATLSLCDTILCPNSPAVEEYSSSYSSDFSKFEVTHLMIGFKPNGLSNRKFCLPFKFGKSSLENKSKNIPKNHG